jgi:hypothetical protein
VFGSCATGSNADASRFGKHLRLNMHVSM